MIDSLQVRAMTFAMKAHEGQMYGEHPYGYHLSQVVQNVRIRKAEDSLLPTYVAVAWLHDVLEDTSISYIELEREFGICVADAVARLTKKTGVSYEDYLAGCCESTIACEVKICDTMANLQESFRNNRSKGMAKYPKQLAILVEGAWNGELLFYKESESE
ncbi:metal dependent phosphohydrolase, HD region [Pseudomonas phage PHB09]|uniref:Metal dependent phosphohydrolase, HD region n=1 Tax=Pseudomonas phage PHB09 TaxID=2867265 RepID=A0AAE8XDW4_9CAUD|nr:metal dependent phosphohydrolase, HD region [Pseudomonas phage PHB09]UAV84507.1 metal dependent phosphohydrolase, HD region [Pseudomonas phage PHB09]